LLLILIMAARARAVDPLGIDLAGHPIFNLAGPGTRVVVLIFAASDCPISNRYVPEIARLDHRFARQGVRLWWVFPNSNDSSAVVTEHNRQFAIAQPTVLDVRHTLVRLSHATTTPESAVFVVNGAQLGEVYHGRIDDRYLAFGRERPAPQRHELESAIAAALAGSSVVPPGGPAVGCAIVPLNP
jgi:AhpC/TSA family